MNTSKLLAVAAILSVSSGVNAASVDLFTFGQDDIFIDNNAGTAPTGTTGGTSGTSISTYDASIIGGYRVMNLNGTFFAGTSLIYNGSMGVDTDNNLLVVNTSSGVSATATVQWSGTASLQDLKDSGSSQLLGTNLLDFGNALTYETVAVDLDTYFTVSFYTSWDQWTEIKIKADGPGIDTIALTSAAAPFPGFYVGNAALCGVAINPAIQALTSVYEVNCGASGGVDLTNVNALELVYNVSYNGSPLTQALDLRIGEITSVPEPSIIGLMGIGLLSAGVSARRRKTGIQA